MSQKKAKKANKDKKDRTPADQLLLEFLRLHNLVLIGDKMEVLEPVVQGNVYAMATKIRIRVVYADQLVEKKEESNIKITN